MTVVESYTSDIKLLAKAMALCCDSQLSHNGEILGDPTENALVAFSLKEGLDKNALEAEFPRIAEAPFDSVRKMMSTIHEHGQGVVQYTKGAPDEVLKLCEFILADGKAVPLTDEIKQEITAKNKEYADRALRVLACAYKEYDCPPGGFEPEQIENALVFIGLEAMVDPVRPEAIDALNSCKNAGINVVMITGDHKETATAIAAELGIIENETQAVTGRELDAISDDEFERRIENIFVYARVQPEHKVRIVNMWKQKGFVTAMTGDGVNDAPAIKSGDIGIGMGITGTDVTKNVADMVLADDNFATIVSAVKEGRRIYDNIRKTLQFLLSTNFAEVVAVFTATVMGFVLFKPAHLLFINLVTDTIPAVALGMEHADSDIMEREPRRREEGVFSGGLGFSIVYQGLFIALFTLAAYFVVSSWHDHDFAMTAAFFTLSMCEIFHAFTLRSLKKSVFTLKTRNPAIWGALAASLVLTLSVIYVPVLADMFSLKPLAIQEIAVSLVFAAMIIPVVEIEKALKFTAGKRKYSGDLRGK
jgi:Ca2+-transporting ATPase